MRQEVCCDVENINRGTLGAFLLQLQQKIGDVEASIERLRRGLQTNSATLKQEDARIKDLSERRGTLEGDLRHLENVIRELRPHIERY